MALDFGVISQVSQMRDWSGALLAGLNPESAVSMAEIVPLCTKVSPVQSPSNLTPSLKSLPSFLATITIVLAAVIHDCVNAGVMGSVNEFSG